LRESTHPFSTGARGTISAIPDPAPVDGVAGDLYALVVYLHASANRDLLDNVAREQLSFSQLMLLERLRGGRRRPTMRQVASYLNVSPAGASRIVDELARRGLVRREKDERDFRAKRVLITDRGEDVITRLHAARLERIATFALDELDDEQRDRFARALAPLVERERIAACRPRAS
jgi:DNA-binding MarR family transcriptional regulator